MTESDDLPEEQRRGDPAAVRTIALERLCPLASRAPARSRFVLHAAVLPSLRGNPAAWEIFAVLNQRRDIDHHVAIRTEWDAAADRETLAPATAMPSAAAPTMRNRQLRLATETAMQIVQLISDVSIPPIVSARPFGTDGTSYRLVCGDGFARASFEWWSNGPRAWEPLTVAFANVWSALEALSPDESPPAPPR